MLKYPVTRLHRLALASGLVLASLSAQAQSTTSASASAIIINPLGIAKTSDLVFGRLAVGAVGGGVTVNTAGVVTFSGAGNTLVQPLGNTGNPRAAEFTVSGEAGFTYSVTLPANGTVTLSDGGSNTMPVNAFVSDPAGTGTLSGAGSSPLKVGATLSVGNNQAPGTYTGTFNVTVAYN